MTRGGFPKVRMMTYGRNGSHSISLSHRTDKEQFKEKAKEIMGTCFKTFKGTLYKKFILEDKEPNWDGGEYTK